ncbi:hypothetical protein ABIC63_000492 [Pseudacidovorax sp. 1753]|uniref:hypothetical protein n=1 Tax=Pseudacidovorax sp. 1753 TaxID=3156419 RepID=UPI00339238E8
MTQEDAGRIELLELALAEMEEDLRDQQVEVEMLMELVVRLLQALHTKGSLTLDEVAAAVEAAHPPSVFAQDSAPHPTHSELAARLRELGVRMSLRSR